MQVARETHLRSQAPALGLRKHWIPTAHSRSHTRGRCHFTKSLLPLSTWLNLPLLVSGRLLSTNTEMGQVILSFDAPLPVTPPPPSPSVYATPLGGYDASAQADAMEAGLPQIVLDFQYHIAPGLDGLYTSM